MGGYFCVFCFLYTKSDYTMTNVSYTSLSLLSVCLFVCLFLPFFEGETL